MVAVSIVDTRKTILVDAGSLLVPLDVLGDETEGIARLDGVRMVEMGHGLRKNRNGVVVGRLGADASVWSALRAVWRGQGGEWALLAGFDAGGRAGGTSGRDGGSTTSTLGTKGELVVVKSAC